MHMVPCFHLGLKTPSFEVNRKKIDGKCLNIFFCYGHLSRQQKQIAVIKVLSVFKSESAGEIVKFSALWTV